MILVVILSVCGISPDAPGAPGVELYPGLFVAVPVDGEVTGSSSPSPITFNNLLTDMVLASFIISAMA